MIRALLTAWPTALLATLLAISSVPALSEPASFTTRLVAAAIERTHHDIRYDGSYVKLTYPGGDVPPQTGVCTDVLIRSYRQLDIDLQLLVHEDMKANFSAYPSQRIWGMSKPDRNIDHRRVPNLRRFFTRNGIELGVSNHGGDYLPGDIVSWVLPGNLPHIGIVSNQKNNDTTRPLIVHNIGAGPKLEDMLFQFPITGHYRYEGV